jgi:hypothetical protein
MLVILMLVIPMLAKQMLVILMLVIPMLVIPKFIKPMLAIRMWAILMLVIFRLTTHMLVIRMLAEPMSVILMLGIPRLAILMLVIPKLVICMLVILMLVVPSPKKSKFEVLLFTNALSRHANVQRHKNSKLKKIQRNVPLFMVCKKKLKTSSWHIHSTKNCQKRIRNEKVMASKSVHGQKVKKVPHPTLGNHSENTQTVLVRCSDAFRVQG